MKTARFKFKNGDEFLYDLEKSIFTKKPTGNIQTISQVINSHNLDQDPKAAKRKLTKKQIDDERFEKYKKENNIEEIL